MKRVIALAGGTTALELGLAGVPVEEARSAAAVEQRLVQLMESGPQVVIVDEAYREQFTEWFQTRLARHTGLPIIIFCPGFAEEDPRTDEYINSIVKPAVGFEIRLD